MVAEHQPQTGRYYYYTTDQIGSTRVVTDDLGNVVYAAAYDPYGGVQQTWTNAFNPELKYSGKEQDAESGLYYFGARYYDPSIYRFLSPDPVIPTEKVLYNPQRWNLYGYCGNNPIRYIDQDGRSFLIFIRSAQLLFVCDRNGNLVGVFPASNNLSPKAKGPYPEGRWRYLHHTHQTFPSGFFGFNADSNIPGSLGVHAGSLDWTALTHGCIRTTEGAIAFIHDLHGENLKDGIEFLIVVWDNYIDPNGNFDCSGIMSKIEYHLKGFGKDEKLIDKVLTEIERLLYMMFGPLDFLFDYFFSGYNPLPPQAR